VVGAKIDVGIKQNPGYGGAMYDLGDRLVEIEGILRDLRYVWVQNHQLRLGQLLENLYGCNCIFHREDDVIAEVLKEAVAKGLVSDAENNEP
jgi:hypothetical protein